MRWLCVSLLAAWAGSVVVDAQTRNQIYQYGAYQAYGENYVIRQDLQIIYIIAMWRPANVYCDSPSAATYRLKFEARTEAWNSGTSHWDDVGPGNIASIQLDQDANNPCVIIEVNRRPGGTNDTWGAQDIAGIDLDTTGTAYTYLYWLKIAGNLGGGQMGSFDRIGLVQVGGNLLAYLQALDSVTNTLTVGGNFGGTINANSLSDVSINGTGPHTGSIYVSQSYANTISVNSTATYTGAMYFGGVTGSITLGTLSGSITTHGLTGSILAGNIAGTGSITEYGSAPGSITTQSMAGTITTTTLAGTITTTGLSGSISTGDVASTGSITVHDSASGRITAQNMGGSIKIDDHLSGTIRINGSLLNGPADNDVWVGTAIDTTGAVAVDYDGWDLNDDWASGAVVRVGANTYTGNDRAARVYEISACKADMNNDGEVSYGDINPFVLALNDASAYAAQKPGLDASMLFHADLNCDGVLDYGDINPFVVRLHELCCEPTCGTCPSGQDNAFPSPQQTAIQLALNIHPELYDALVDIAGQAAVGLDDAADRAYWTAVYTSLTE